MTFTINQAIQAMWSRFRYENAWTNSQYELVEWMLAHSGEYLVDALSIEEIRKVIDDKND